jgi:hypothetical protein
MHEYLPQDLALACHSAGLLDSPDGPHTPKMVDIIEEAGPVLEGRDHTDPALITEVRLATGPLLEMLNDDEVGQLLPFIRDAYGKQKIPNVDPG